MIRDVFQATILGPVGSAIDGIGWLSDKASDLVVNQAVGITRNRPHPWSSYQPYVTWRGLTDRSYLARHLPPRDLEHLPAPEQVRRLFERPTNRQRLSSKSTCLFPAFAQYLTDGFLRTVPKDVGRTTSNHEIDLCPLYGRTPDQTRILRLGSEVKGQKGRLRSWVDERGEEWAPILFEADGTTPAGEFAKLDPPLGSDNLTDTERRRSLFAIGGDRANSTPFTAMMNTLFLREHNRIAAGLEQRNPDWDDTRVFETARNIAIVLFIKIVVEDYINHITPLPFQIKADPSVAWNAPWNRPNWMTVEFSLLYRWHSLLPDAIRWDSESTGIALKDFTLDNRPLLRVGLDSAFSFASTQPAGDLGAFNTSAALIHIEDLAVAQGRTNRLDTYNAYRVAFGMDPARSWEDITTNPEVQALLAELYKEPDNVEFYPGLFAEDRVEESALPNLILRMVAVDAFSQALTNPLLSEHVWNNHDAAGNNLTFTNWGMEQIERTGKLSEILSRNVPVRGLVPIEMTQAGWRYGCDPRPRDRAVQTQLRAADD